MNAPNPTHARLDRLTALLAQDPANTLLLAEAADCALAAAAFDRAHELIATGLRMDDDKAAWQFRLASVHIAQRQLAQARKVLEELKAAGVAQAGVDHNLAYVAFLEGRFEECVAILAPWLDAEPRNDNVSALWLRAMHHMEHLEEAWARVEAWGLANLQPATAATASLVALDLSRLDAADALASKVLAALPASADAGIAKASVLLARSELKAARDLLSRVTVQHPHQARGWSTLGYAALLERDADAATRHLQRALALQPDDVDSRVALGWARLLAGDVEGAAAAFREARAQDEGSADAHGGLAVTFALEGDRASASMHAQSARKLQPNHAAADYAEAILSGSKDDLRGLQDLLAKLPGKPPGGKP